MATFHTYGTILESGDGDGVEEFFPIAQVMSITPPPLARSAIDVTHLSSPGTVVSGGHRERISGIADTGPLSCTIFYDPAETTHNLSAAVVDASGPGLQGLWLSGAIVNFQFTLSDTGVTVFGPFPAFVSNFTISELGVDAAGQATVELTLSGEPTAILT